MERQIELAFHPGAFIRDGECFSFVSPYEDWRYRYIEGIGNDVNIDFVDVMRNGSYPMTKDPAPLAGRFIDPATIR